MPDTTIARHPAAAFGGGTLIGALGGLIGLGGAEFRLPLLIGVFQFAALEAIILNKAMSLAVVASALLFRTKTIPIDVVFQHGLVVVNLLAGSLLGAWLGAGWATRLRSEVLYKLIAVLLAAIALILIAVHFYPLPHHAALAGMALWIAGMVAGFGIGVVAALMGVAGGELLIPTLVLLYGLDIKLAGSLSLAVSLPTMITGFMRYGQDESFKVLTRNKTFAVFMAVGSVAGALLGGLLLGTLPDEVLRPALAVILLLSSAKVWRHK